MENLLLFALLSWVTGSPAVALLALLLLSGAGYGYLSGRLFRIPQALGRWRAIRELRTAVTRNPHDATARMDLGRLLVEAGRPRAALPHLEAAHARMADSPETRYYLGLARLRAGDAEGGRALVAEALARDPKLRYGEPLLALADADLAEGRPADAVQRLETLRSIHASSVEGRYKLARAYALTGQSDRARAVLEEAVVVYRGSPAFHRRDQRLWRWRAGWLRRRLAG